MRKRWVNFSCRSESFSNVLHLSNEFHRGQAMSNPAPGQVSPGIPDGSASGNGQKKVWTVGTLAYTSGGLGVLFFWLLGGDFAWNLKERAVVPVAQLMLRSFQASDFLVGLLVGSIPAALGMILGPIASVKSDRHRGKLGRRIPFLLVPTPFIVLSMLALGGAPWLAGKIHLALGDGSPGIAPIGITLFILFWLVFEVATVVANIIFGALINDVVPQPLIGRFFGLFRAVGLIAGILFNASIIGYAETHYFGIFCGAGLLYGVCFATMCLKVKEGEYPDLDSSMDQKPGGRETIVSYFRECYSNPYYRWLFAAATFGMLANVPVNSFSVFYAKSLGMDIADYGKCLAVTYVISLVLAYPLGVLADRFHPLRMGIWTTIIYGALMLWAAVGAVDAKTFSLFFVLHGVITGSYMTATASLGQRLYPKMKFAQFASAWGLVFGLGFIAAAPLTGLLLDFLGHAYRCTFLISGCLALLGAVAYVVTDRFFVALGGPERYVAPE
jgi:MFS family permease